MGQVIGAQKWVTGPGHFIGHGLRNITEGQISAELSSLNSRLDSDTLDC